MSKFGFDKILNAVQSEKDKLANQLITRSLKYFVNKFENYKVSTVETDNLGDWKDLSASTWKQKKSSKILQESGNLLRTLKNSISGRIWTKCEIKVNVDYSSYHQYGTSKLAKRKILGQNAELTKIQTAIIENWLNKLFK